MKHIMSKRDDPSIVSRLIQKLSGTAKQAVERVEVDVSTYATDDGVYPFLEWLQAAVGIQPHVEQSKQFNHYFSITRKPSETMQEWSQREAMAMQNMQEAL